MPKGPRGEKRPADAIGRAVMIGKIATGAIEHERDQLSSAAAELGRKGGQEARGKHDGRAAEGNRQEGR